MASDKRGVGRKPLQRPVWIEFGHGVRLVALLINISDTGAELHVLGAKGLPPHFTLLLASDGSVVRRCRVAWCKGSHIGVVFIAHMARC